jgi:hypothetical protein
MRKAHQILAGLLAVEVVIQAMAIAYALAGLGKWIDDGNTLDKAVKKRIENGDVGFQGTGGFAIHGINGQMLIPLIAIALLVVSLLAAKEIEGAGKRAGILLGMVVVQVILGMTSEDVVLLAPLHALNGFGIFAMAVVTARKAGEPATVAA